MLTKEIFDRFAGFIGLAVAIPVILLTWIAIAIVIPGAPAIFRQKRVGKDGRLFTLVKFRTMRPAHGGSSVSVAGESRITPLGAVLRRWKIDELPELWNVIKGDMSFVGPRPDVPGYADCLEGDCRRILSLKPGITGAATLRYRYEEEILASQEDPQTYNDSVIYPDKVRLNLLYLDSRSFGLDLRMILSTALPSLQSRLLPSEFHAIMPGSELNTPTTQSVNIYAN
ncbi:sugar transferase [Duncaniella muris]|uniref:sugar transferase n=1 Tax=Duncaniella muris TaxID=2094150 RepID=UPI000B1F9309|nr:sugar transferase [Duncaniella muris]